MASIVINEETPINEYDATASQTIFNTSFTIYQEDEVKIYQYGENDTPNDTSDLLVLNVDYTLSGLGVSGGFTFTLLVAATLNDHLTAIRDIPIDRISQYALTGKFSTPDVNLDLNYQTMFSQDRRMYERIKGLYYNNGAVIEDLDRRLPKLAASQYWQMNSGGTAIQAVKLADNANVNTLRSELASQTAGAPGSDLIGVYTAEVSGATLTAYLNTVEPPIADNIAIVENATDTTKRIKFNASGLTTATTRTITMPDSDVNLGQATTTTRGLAEIATDAEILAGTNDTNIITPKGLRDNNTRILQRVSVFDGEFVSGSTIMPLDDTIPQNTEGDEYMTLAITPKRSDSSLKIEVLFYCGAQTADTDLTIALFQDSVANALAATSELLRNGSIITLSLSFIKTSGSTSAQTYKLRAGPSAGSGTTLNFNGAAGARLLGGVAASNIIITEYI